MAKQQEEDREAAAAQREAMQAMEDKIHSLVNKIALMSPEAGHHGTRNEEHDLKVCAPACSFARAPRTQ